MTAINRIIFAVRWSFMGIIVLTIFLLTTCGVTAQGKRIDLSDFSIKVNLDDPQISPDGKQIVLVVSRINFEENRHETELVLIDIATGSQHVLTYNRPKVRHPRWSPGGDILAFLDADKKGKMQVFVMPMRGGDTICITNTLQGVSFYKWNPNGKELAFVTEDIAEEKTGVERHNKSFEVGDNVYLAKSEPMPFHIWLVSAEGGSPKRLNSGKDSICTMFTSPIEWSLDGNSIAFISQSRPHSGEFINTSLKVLEVETQEQHVVVPGPKCIHSAVFSPDGNSIAYSSYNGIEPLFIPGDIFIVPTSGGKSEIATPDIDRDISCSQFPENYCWMPDGKSILVMSYDLTRVSIWLQPIGGKPRKLVLGEIDPSSKFSVGHDGALAFCGVTPHKPTELYYMESINSVPKCLTNFNAELASRNLGSVEYITWDGPDGFKEYGVLVYPPDYDANRRYPLMLVIHGGPMGTSTRGFTFRGQSLYHYGFFRHLMAANDWIIFDPNYRGSSNMGREYQRAIINDAGDGPGRDIMAGIAAVKEKVLIDEDRIALYGWSYGGFMTTWLISHYQGFKAAVAGAAVTDWFDQYNLNDINLWVGYGLEGSPWRNNNFQNYVKQSPITYAPNIRTPTLILSNTDDPRVTVTQSYKLYHALKDNGVPVQFIAYPLPGHSAKDPVHQRDVYRRTIEWIEEYFK